MGRPGLIGMAARTAVVAGTATAVSGGVARHQQRKEQERYEQQQYEQQQAYQQQQAMAQQAAQEQAYQQAAAAPPGPTAASPAGGDMMAQLQQLATMHSQGILSDAEFAAAKAKLLG
jgi:sortase (surface protein transpeptidase)